MMCGEWSLVKADAHGLEAISLPCRSWSCEHCGEKRQRELRGLARAGEPDTFITLTAKPDPSKTSTERARELRDAWRTIRRRACKAYGYRSIPFLAVFEKTKRGMPHLHILCRVRWLDQRWLSAQMRELMGSPVVDIRRVKSLRGAAKYIAKYLAKSPIRFVGCKRYWRSQDYDKQDHVENDTDEAAVSPWHLVKQPLEYLQREWAKIGIHAELHRGRLQTTYQVVSVSASGREVGHSGALRAPP